ncbi:MAG: hypothetical protein IJM27_11210 [Eubacterium sp.]|nr:hypothetical protein [Eubacterium sp.]
MSDTYYVVPWAICDTDNIYIRKAEASEIAVGDAIDDWTVQKVVTDRKTKDIYVIVDVYRGLRLSKGAAKDVGVVSLTNSVHYLEELGYRVASEEEAEYIRRKILKIKQKTE